MTSRIQRMTGWIKENTQLSFHFDVMRMFRKRQMRFWQLFPGVKGEVYLVENQFRLHSRIAYCKFWKSLMDEFEAA